MLQERRQQRSGRQIEAIHYQLQSVARETGVQALFLADPDGLLLGAADSEHDCEVLAAYSPLIMKSAGDPDRQMKLLSRMGEVAGCSIDVRAFDLLGDRMTLGAISSGPLSDQDRMRLERAMIGVRRILRRRPIFLVPPASANGGL